MIHADIHEHIAHKAVAIGRAVIEDLSHHGVVKVRCRRVGYGLNHEPWVPQHVGVRRVNVAVDGILHF